MPYVLDTGFFVVARGYYPDTFPSFWEKLGDAVAENIVSSVREVKNEIEKYGGEQEHLLNWVKAHPAVFERPDEEEQGRIREVMRRFPGSLPEKKQAGGNPWADPFVIARAWRLGATVVTGEKSTGDTKGKSIRIPDVCDELGVKHTSPEGFMRAQGWRF